MLPWNAPFSLIQIWYVYTEKEHLEYLFTIILCKNKIYSFVTNGQVILSEEVAASKLTLYDITKQICDAVQARAELGIYFWQMLE